MNNFDWFWLVLGVCAFVIFLLIVTFKDLLTVPRERDGEEKK